MSTAAPAVSEPQAVPVERLEDELAQVMRAQGAPALWCRMSNLIVFCENPEDCGAVERELATLLHLHPARVLLLQALSESSGDDVQAWIRHWSRARPEGPSLGWEQVTLRAAGAGLGRLPFLVRELVLGDLPVNFWWVSGRPPSRSGPVVHEMMDRAQQVVYDSRGWPAPVRDVASVGIWLKRFERLPTTRPWRTAADINWRRLKYWRRLLAQTLDPNCEPGALESIAEVHVVHGPHGLVQAWQLVAWLATRLAWQVKDGHIKDGAEMTWALLGTGGPVSIRLTRKPEGVPGVQSVRLTCAPRGTRSIIGLNVQDGCRLVALREDRDTAPRTLTLPQQEMAVLVARQLSDRDHDPVFDQSMATAAHMARLLNS